jgi:hypothetical protein
VSRLIWCVTNVLGILLSGAFYEFVEPYVPEWVAVIIFVATLGLAGACGGGLIAKYEFSQLERRKERHMQELRKRYGYTLGSKQDKGQSCDKK